MATEWYKSKRWRWSVPTFVFVVFVTLWGCTLWFVPYVARTSFGIQGCTEKTKQAACPTDAELLSSYGAVGDLFGATNALFGGLALAGVALTLWLQTNGRRRDARPLLIPFFSSTSGATMAGGDGSRSGNVEITQPSVHEGSILFPLEVQIPLLNQSAEAALNVKASATLLDGSIKFEQQLAVPIGAQHSQDVKLRVSLLGAHAKKLQTELTRDGGRVRMALRMEYSNLDEIRWFTAVTYWLSLDDVTRTRDAGLLTNAVDQSPRPAPGPEALDPDVGWTTNTRIGLQTEPEGNSWKHGEV